MAALGLTARGIYSAARDGVVRLGRAGLAINLLAVVQARRFNQVWAAPIFLALITVLGLGYLAVAKPHAKAVQ